MNFLLLARSARVHSVRNCISFDPNVFFPFLYRNNLKCSGCLLCENTELHFRKGIVLEKKPLRDGQGSALQYKRISQKWEGVCDKEAGSAHHPGFLHALGLSCLQWCQSVFAVWWVQCHSEKVCWQRLLFFWHDFHVQNQVMRMILINLWNFESCFVFS